MRGSIGGCWKGQRMVPFQWLLSFLLLWGRAQCPFPFKVFESLRLLQKFWLHLASYFWSHSYHGQFRKHHSIVVNGCPMCLKEGELVNHLMVSCSARSLWINILSWFKYSWVLPNSLASLFEAWRQGASRGRIMWKAVFAILWVI